MIDPATHQHPNPKRQAMKRIENLTNEEAVEALDASNLACSRCGERAAWAIIGWAAELAICKVCDGMETAEQAASNCGEFPAPADRA